MAGTPYDGGGIAHHGRRHPGGHRRRAARAGCARLRGRDARPGHDDRRGQERLRAHRRRRGPLPAAGRRGHRRDHLPRRARRPARVRRRPGRLRRPGHRPDARGLRAARPLGRRLLRARVAHAFDGDEAAGRARGRRAPRAWACACTPTSSRPGPACSWPSSSAPPAPTTARYLTDADVDALAGGDDGGDPAARRRVLHPLALPRRAAPARRGRDGRAGHRLQPGHAASRRRCRSASRSPSARCG